jgi:hypothetical protein
MSALVLHLGLENPSKDVQKKHESVLIWGAGSSIGFYAVQIAAQVHLLPKRCTKIILLTSTRLGRIQSYHYSLTKQP